MRTTLTLDPDVAALVRRAMAERGVPFKQVVNDALRRALGETTGAAHRTPSFRMGEPAVPLEKALQIAAALEDEELLRRMSVRK